VSEPERYTVTFTAAARRQLGRLPLSAATALYEHLTGPVAANPHRLGKPLDAPFEEVLSTRRGGYRALYTFDDRARIVTVLAVAHRRDAYRPR
jgi:mRNA interferase RelE/StbE